VKIDSGKNRLGFVLERFQITSLQVLPEGAGRGLFTSLMVIKYGIKWVIRCGNCGKCT